MDKAEPGRDHLGIYERVHPQSLQIYSFHETTLIFKVNLKKHTVQENGNQEVNGLLPPILN